ncbi:hypothetical protein Gogos_020357, partial [Gossypium gossypioides]|nr:hypothetical protein [Gossypium gossypioides]
LSLGRLSDLNSNLNDTRVAEFIDPSSRTWKKELIESTFPEDVTEKIQSIPLSEVSHEDFQVWCAEASGEYIVRSAYKLLQGTEDNPRAYALQDDYKDFYKKLWLLDIPSKIKITVWKISWNFLATRANMVLKKLTNITACPRCGSGTENMDHLFCECPVSESCRIFCCALWAIWGDRNARVHKKGGKSGKEIGRYVQSYITELNEIDKSRSKASITVKKWRKPPDRIVKINFDAAYDGRQNRSAVGLVARDREGTVLLSCSEIHHRITSAFAAEAVACRKALQTGIGMKWESIIIERDSLSIIRKCKEKSPDKSLVSAYIYDIHQLRLKLKECSFEYVPRSANSLMHILAKETLKRNVGVYLVGRVPEAAEDQAASERVREPD